MPTENAYAGWEGDFVWNDSSVTLIHADDMFSMIRDIIRYATREEDGHWEGAISGPCRVSGSFTALAVLSDATTEAIQDDMLSGDKRTAKFLDNNGAGWQATALLSKFEAKRGGHGNVAEISVGVEFHGKPTKVSGS